MAVASAVHALTQFDRHTNVAINELVKNFTRFQTGDLCHYTEQPDSLGHIENKTKWHVYRSLIASQKQGVTQYTEVVRVHAGIKRGSIEFTWIMECHN